MSAFKSELELIQVARALVGKGNLSPAERRLPGGACRNSKLIKETRAAILDGLDPLGDAFIEIRSAAIRRRDGAVYTPKSIVDSMLAWAFAQGEPSRVVDPGCGSGRYLVAAGKLWRKAALVGVEKDPVAALMARANLTVNKMAHRATIHVCDYMRAPIMQIPGRTYFVGNPPYVRHHQISATAKAWFSKAAAQFEIKASQLAGLHIYFFLRTLQLSKSGDIGTFVTSSEWMDVNYGQSLRDLLVGPLGGESVHVIRADAQPFKDTMTTGAVTCFRPYLGSGSLRFQEVTNSEQLENLDGGRPRSSADALQEKRWTIFIRQSKPKPRGSIELGEIARVSRGQVTGGNSVWIAGEHSSGIPDRFLFPTITKARELIQAGAVLSNDTHLKRVINLPRALESLKSSERKAVDKFLKYCISEGVPEGYVASHRKAWWSVGLYEPAPILCTYMARRAPAFVRNAVGARHINIAHGIYPREKMTTSELDSLVRRLTLSVEVSSGRTYAGGLTKFEPGELERILLSPLDFATAA